jgi:hypothetical protein
MIRRANKNARASGTTLFIDTEFTGSLIGFTANKIENKYSKSNVQETIFLLCKPFSFFYLEYLRRDVVKI